MTRDKKAENENICFSQFFIILRRKSCKKKMNLFLSFEISVKKHKSIELFNIFIQFFNFIVSFILPSTFFFFFESGMTIFAFLDNTAQDELPSSKILL